MTERDNGDQWYMYAITENIRDVIIILCRLGVIDFNVSLTAQIRLSNKAISYEDMDKMTYSMILLLNKLGAIGDNHDLVIAEAVSMSPVDQRLTKQQFRIWMNNKDRLDLDAIQ